MARNCYCKPDEDFDENDYIDNTPLPEGFNDDRSFNEDDYVDNTPLPEGIYDDRSFNEDDYVDNTPLPEGFNDDRSFNEDDYIDNTPLPEGINDDRSFNEDDFIDNTPLPEGINDDRSFTEDDYINNEPLPEEFNDDSSFTEDDYIDNTSVPEGFNDDRSFTEDDYIENTPLPHGMFDPIIHEDNVNHLFTGHGHGAGPVFGTAKFPSLNMSMEFDQFGNIINILRGSPASQSPVRATSPQRGQAPPRSQGSTPHPPRNDVNSRFASEGGVPQQFTFPEDPEGGQNSGTRRPLAQKPQLGTATRKKLFVDSVRKPHMGIKMTRRQGDSKRSPSGSPKQMTPHSGVALKGNDGSPKSGTSLGNVSGSRSTGSVQSGTEAVRKPKSPCSLGLRPCSAATPKSGSKSPRSNTPAEFAKVVPRTPVKIDPNVSRISQEARTPSPYPPPRSFSPSLGSRLGGGTTAYPNSLQPQKQSPSNRQGSSQSPDNRQSTGSNGQEQPRLGDTSSRGVSPSAPIQDKSHVHYRHTPIPLLPIMSTSQLVSDSYDDEDGYVRNNDRSAIPSAQSSAGRQVLDASSGVSVPGNLGSRQQSPPSPRRSPAPGTSQPPSPIRAPAASPQPIAGSSRRPSRLPSRQPPPTTTWHKDDPNNWFTEADYAPYASPPRANAPNALGSFKPIRSSSADGRGGNATDSSTEDILELSLIPHDSF